MMNITPAQKNYMRENHFVFLPEYPDSLDNRERAKYRARILFKVFKYIPKISLNI
jgi:hypothetical protein